MSVVATSGTPVTTGLRRQPEADDATQPGSLEHPLQAQIGAGAPTWADYVE
jgi:hypothetical protein